MGRSVFDKALTAYNENADSHAKEDKLREGLSEDDPAP